MIEGRLGKNSEIENPHLEFQDEGHIYLYKGERFTSVTKVIEQYQRPFAYETILTNYANKHKRNRDEVAAEWKKKNEDSKILGSFVHNIAEQIFTSDNYSFQTGDEIPLDTNYLDAYIEYLLSFKDFLLSNGATIYSEVMLCLPYKKLTGTTDLVVYWPEHNLANIMDFKTNRMKYKGKSFVSGFKSLLPPFEDMEDSKLNIYSLQVLAYSYMLKETMGWNIGTSKLIHFDDDEITEYEVPYEQSKASAVINNFGDDNDDELYDV